MLTDPDLSKFKSEGDLNISPRRAAWAKENIDGETQRWLDLDAQYFLHNRSRRPASMCSRIAAALATIECIAEEN